MVSFRNKLLMSINCTSFLGTATEFSKGITVLDKEGLVEGFEMYHRPECLEDYRFSFDLAHVCNTLGWKLQMHGQEVDKVPDIDLNFYSILADIVKEEINVVLHPVSGLGDSGEEKLQTLEHFNRLSEKVKSAGHGVKLCLENLNSHKGVQRCGIYDVMGMLPVMNNRSLCLDIGHAVSSGEEYINLPKELWETVSTVHLHDIGELGEDHTPFYHKNVSLSEFSDTITNCGYKGNIVLEIALDFLSAKQYRSKLLEYINQFSIVREHLDNSLRARSAI